MNTKRAKRRVGMNYKKVFDGKKAQSRWNHSILKKEDQDFADFLCRNAEKNIYTNSY